MVFRSRQACGQCQEVEVVKEYQERGSRLREESLALEEGGWAAQSKVQAELDALEAEWSTRSFAISRQFPSQRLEKYLRPEKGQCTTRIGTPSPLKQPVLPEDIPDAYVASHGSSASWDADWGSGWKTMDEELEEIEADKPAEIREYEREMQATRQAWLAERTEDQSGEDLKGPWGAFEEVGGHDGDDDRQSMAVADAATGPCTEDSATAYSLGPCAPPVNRKTLEDASDQKVSLTAAPNNNTSTLADCWDTAAQDRNPLCSADTAEDEALPLDLTSTLSSSYTTETPTENTPPRVSPAPHLRRRPGQRTPSLRSQARRDAADSDEAERKDGPFVCFTRSLAMVRT